MDSCVSCYIVVFQCFFLVCCFAPYHWRVLPWVAEFYCRAILDISILSAVLFPYLCCCVPLVRQLSLLVLCCCLRNVWRVNHFTLKYVSAFDVCVCFFDVWPVFSVAICLTYSTTQILTTGKCVSFSVWCDATDNLLSCLLTSHKQQFFPGVFFADVHNLSWLFCLSFVRTWFTTFVGIIIPPMYIPLPSARQHPNFYGDRLEVTRKYYQNCSVLDCVTQCLQSAAHLYEQFLQVQQIGFVTLGPLHRELRQLPRVVLL